MEEIKTSQRLEQEILEDARKKAERILRGGEKSVKEVEEEWNKREQAFVQEHEKELDRKKTKIEAEMSASIPLELKRIELEELNKKYENFLELFFLRLSDEEFGKLLQARLSEVALFFANKSVTLSYKSVPPVKKLVESVIPGISILSVEEAETTRGLSLQTEDGAIRFRLTIDELLEEVQEKYRKELFDALWLSHDGE
ncbi:MAG: hypothetical protein SNJ78_01465 [Spirochaetales bacterium]